MLYQLYEVAVRNCDDVKLVTFDGEHGYGHKHLHKSPDLIPAVRLLILYFTMSLSRVMAVFPGAPGLAGTKVSPFRILLELRMIEVVVTTGVVRRVHLQSPHHHQQTPSFIQARYRSCHPTNSVKALKGN